MAATKKFKKELLQMRFSAFELNNIIIALLENVVNKKFVSNVKELFESFGESSYINDPQKAPRVFLIKKLASSILDKDIQNKENLLGTLDLSGKYNNDCTEILNELYENTIAEKQSIDLDRKISSLLKFSVIENTTDELITHVNNIKSENYEDLDSEINVIEDKINVIQQDFKNYRETIDESNNTVSLEGSELLTRLNKIIEKEKNPSSRVKTGIKMFNELIGGGYENGRVYCCLAPMKNWKSGWLLNSCLWAKKYNNLKPKDPTKKPIALYITLENTVDETIKRILSHCEGNNYQCKEHSAQENARILQAHGLFSPEDNQELGIQIMYKPNKSITVGDIKTIMEDYEKIGKEVVFLAVDYIKRIRPSIITKDLRIDLGNIADELHVLAVEKDIPIVTAMQLNRSAISEIDNATSFDAKMAAFNRIGTSNVGESIDIPQNVDLCFTMLRTVDAKVNEEGNVESVDKYVSIRIVASRYTSGDVDSFIHRFKEGNDMSLDEDENSSSSHSIPNMHAFTQNRIAENGIKTRGPRHV